VSKADKHQVALSNERTPPIWSWSVNVLLPGPPYGSANSLAQPKEEEGLRRLGYQNIRSRYQTRNREYSSHDINRRQRELTNRGLKPAPSPNRIRLDHPVWQGRSVPMSSASTCSGPGRHSAKQHRGSDRECE
jgi:hypothetical protein